MDDDATQPDFSDDNHFEALTILPLAVNGIRGPLGKSLVVAKEDERLVILSLGKLVGVYGPGLSIVIPFLDRVIRIKVETLVGWRELSETELRERATQIAIQSVSQLN